MSDRFLTRMGGTGDGRCPRPAGTDTSCRSGSGGSDETDALGGPGPAGRVHVCDDHAARTTGSAWRPGDVQ